MHDSTIAVTRAVRRGRRTPGAGPVSSRRILGSDVRARAPRPHTRQRGCATRDDGHASSRAYLRSRAFEDRQASVRTVRDTAAAVSAAGSRANTRRPHSLAVVPPHGCGVRAADGGTRLRGCLRGRLRCRLRGRLRCRLDEPLRPGEAAGRRPRLWPCVPVHSRRTRGRQYACARCGERCLLRAHLSTRNAWPRVGSRFARSTSTSTFIAPRPLRGETSRVGRQRAQRVRGLRRACVVLGIWAALGAPLRERGALCTTAQRVGLKPRKAPCADRDSSSREQNLENRHDRGTGSPLSGKVPRTRHGCR